MNTTRIRNGIVTKKNVQKGTLRTSQRTINGTLIRSRVVYQNIPIVLIKDGKQKIYISNVISSNQGLVARIEDKKVRVIYDPKIRVCFVR